ncbi:MAG TPA: PQQ-binding-like beta-propeller repeat protein [Ktedonobacterales bacterium]|jgi:outer membrane protein assembly factor BamB
MPFQPHTKHQLSGVLSLAVRGALLAVALLAAACDQQQPAPQHPVKKKPTKDGTIAIQQEESGAWLTFEGDPLQASVNSDEKSITTTTVSNLHRDWHIQLPDLADERPILVRNLTMPDGQKYDVLYVTTDKATLIAMNAENGAIFWETTPDSADNPKYTKSTPAADPANNLIYSYGLDGKVHRFQLTTGKELQGNGWPVQVTLMPLSEKVSSPLNLINGYLYVTTASFSGDAPPYQGHMVAINVKTGSTHIFNSLCNDHTHLLALNECQYNGGGIWARPAVVQDPVTGHIFFTTSDGYFTANQGGSNWGDSIIEMTPDGSTMLDSYTPENYAQEAFQNRDLGSTAPVMLPAIPQSRTPYLAVQAGKEGLLRVVNRQDLSGQGGPTHVGGEIQTVQLPDLCPTLAQPVAWKDPNGAIWLIVATLCHMDAFQVVTSPQGVTTLQKAWYLGIEATSPIIAGGVLFVATGQNLLALDPTTGHQLWSSAQQSAGGNIAGIHWETPIVVGGRLYCPDESGQITAYNL